MIKFDYLFLLCNRGHVYLLMIFFDKSLTHFGDAI